MIGYDLSNVFPAFDESGGGGGGGVGNVRSDDYDWIREVTQAELDALDPADPRTLYTIVG